MGMEREEQATFCKRIREVRVECFGDEGVERLADLLGIPVRTWLNYEDGVSMPATVLLRFLRVTEAGTESLLGIGDVRDSESGDRESWFDAWTPGRN
jgi:hypothetical protein